MPLPAYNADDDAFETTDRLAQPNQDDPDFTSTLSSSPLSTLKAVKHNLAVDDYYTEKKQPNPDVMGLKALRNKVFAEDTPTDNKEKVDEDSIFAKAAKEEAALKKTLHKQAAVKKAKKENAHMSKTVVAPSSPKAVASGVVKAQAPVLAAKKVKTLKAPLSTAADVEYKQGDVEKAQGALKTMETREQEEAAGIKKERQQLKMLKVSRAMQQQAAVDASNKAEEAKTKEHDALKAEMAKIKLQEDSRLAALAKKLNALGGQTPMKQAAAVHRHHSTKVKTAVMVQKPAPTLALAQKNPVKKAMSNLAEDEKEDSVFLGHKRQMVQLPSKTVYKDAAREEQLYRQILEVNQLKKGQKA